MSDVQRVLRPAEAARVLGIGRDKVFELLRSGQLRSYKEGRLRRIPAEAVEEYISRKLTEADAERVGGSERLRE
ncbi:hypothetical protein Ppa06_67150 [Planomonospora parontospora subsp. parontospora]|uniref:Helix-turn-helix domain-containing protein n=2 Tax=Planomonospora parontospora TaxID=58119 RepID=A0AA37BNZ8_9ACTN|nr:excisionase family DNA-binding protein [Planomonospora parontospora]GGK98942.1 hypothetical protein GCM10010126_67930 [Planomonospora parontospora]GII12917.1 hypothetical protein Ppa06_67150 [Planomonospora parontospora subsp. parontospora]